MKNIAVIGGGVMGRGIAYVAAVSGYNVVLQDISAEALEKAKHYIESELSRSVEKGYIKQEQKDTAIENLAYSTDMAAAARNADLVIEAVLELMDVKIDVFQKLDQYAPAHAVLATNTSTMSPTEIAAQTSRPEKCVAMHFFNPPHKMKLIEIVRGLDTSNETVAIAKAVAKQMNKESVEVNEYPGFVTSRMNCLIGNEAMYMLMEGVASAEDIDKAIKLGLNHPMGPLELADLVGLDTRLRNMEYLHKTLGEKYRPCPLLVKYVKAGRLGRKSGGGFYNYDNN
ncbi:3-hydroxyacyl-CoA dehydrogenase [Brevibacillus sp. LEMMJ03]|uniref:3-hydroxyacyl-CoA dehydrogenase n=1 Tax=Brevibacillus sp. LEMMJ03 TaxID=2595056 RepID=UPI00163DB839|nr:3-hydroxyacyl-CoA dehydrogenase [Brevibacillus sp. LEMMJ03]